MVPFESLAQMRFMYSKHPRLAKKWAKKQKKKGKSFKSLPERKKRTRDEFILFEPILEVFDG